MSTPKIPKGDVAREAVHALRGYVYQIYQSAMGWVDLGVEEVLYLEVAEDFAKASSDALEAVQVKDTKSNVTLVSKGVLDSIDSFVRHRDANPDRLVFLRFLSTSKIGKEKSPKHRVGEEPALETWRRLARAGDVSDLKAVLLEADLSARTKEFIEELSEDDFRPDFLQRIRFDCGAPDLAQLERVLKARLLQRLRDYGGVPSQLDACLNDVIVTLLEKASSPGERFVDRLALEEIVERATQITINKSQYEAQTRLATGAVAAALSGGTILDRIQANLPRPIDAVPLPRAIAVRGPVAGAVKESIEDFGFVWIHGAAGTGKTVATRLVARNLGGNWALVNLRGYNADQIRQTLEDVAQQLPKTDFRGIVLDDFDRASDPSALAGLHYLQTMARHRDIVLAVTASKPLGPTHLFEMGFAGTVNRKVEDFSVADVREILEGLGVEASPWAELIHLVSGAGHPQLVIATIQSMANRGWNRSEATTMSDLFSGSEEVETVRRETRERLLRELPETSRRLLERLSLKLGPFRRDFVLEAAKIEPEIPDGGIVFDGLLGSWIDQQDSDRFSLSPLLSGFAAKVLSETEKQSIHHTFADNLLSTRTLDPAQANSALFSALSGKNTGAIVGLCFSLMSEEAETLEAIAPFLTMFTLLDPEKAAYPDDPHVGQTLRGTQLILLAHEDDRDAMFRRALEAFERESRDVEHSEMRSTMRFLVYTKLLLSSPKFGAIPKFWELLERIERFFEEEADTVPPEVLEGYDGANTLGLRPASFMLVNQARMLRKIEDLPLLFGYLANCSTERRDRLLSVFSEPEFDVDMLVSGAWMSEHKAKSVDAPVHAEVFRELEERSRGWTPEGIAVSCRKFRAIILDEYGGEKEAALAVLDEGLNEYGATNSELVRAKAKVFHRAGEHAESLELSRQLMQSGAPFAETEKAFLGRDAAISAEKQGDYEAAREFYLYGSAAAGKCEIADMHPMRIGLLADAALAGWHAGDRATCLRDFVAVLHDLKDLDADASLRAAHCHSTIRHVLLWMWQTASGEPLQLPDGSETRIYPGVMSNPEPHPSIADRPRTCIELAWYMLASVENCADLDVGITGQLDRFLPNGPVVAGQQMLSSSRMHRAVSTLNIDLFFDALRHTMSEFAFSKSNFGGKPFDIENPTFARIPPATPAQLEEMRDLAGLFVLCFASAAIFNGRSDIFTALASRLKGASGFRLSDKLVSSLVSGAGSSDFSSSLAYHLFQLSNAEEPVGMLSPHQMFEVAYRAMEIAKSTANRQAFGPAILGWLSAQWKYIWDSQRFRLKNPSAHEGKIEALLENAMPPWDKAAALLMAALPMMAFGNEAELEKSIRSFPLA